MKPFNDDPRRAAAESLLREMVEELNSLKPRDRLACGVELTRQFDGSFVIDWITYTARDSYMHATEPDEAMRQTLNTQPRILAEIQTTRAKLRELEQKAGLTPTMTVDELKATYRGAEPLPA